MSESSNATGDVRPWPARKAIEIWTALRPRALRLYALAVFKTNAASVRFSVRTARYRSLATPAAWFVAIGAHVAILLCAHWLDSYLAGDSTFSEVKAACLGIGAALIGATAIASSFILFALQVNVDRMPAGLFRQLSADRRLLCAFGLAFALSAALAFCSLANDPSKVSIIALGAVEACVVTPIIYLYAYRRALRLINPIEQLRIVVTQAAKELRAWSRRADLAAYFFTEAAGSAPQPEGKKADYRRRAFFGANAQWDAGLRQAIGHLTLYARYYSERGDHEVSYAALQLLLALNVSYIKAKGCTFFSTNPLIDNPFVTDAIINETLEALRQTMKIGLTRGDERQATQTLETLEALVMVYLTIEYPGLARTRTHALLAAGYLSSAVESILPHGMPDVLMDGMRRHGKAAVSFIGVGNGDDAAGLIDKLGVLGAACSATEQLRPVTLTAVAQLANITLALITVREGAYQMAFRHVSDSVQLIADFLLKMPDTPFVSPHSTNLAPYFSYQETGLKSRLIQLVNELGKDSVDVTVRQRVTANLAIWSDNPQRQFKDLMLLAIEKRSGFTFDILNWIADLIEVLLAASNLVGVAAHVQTDLRSSALQLAWLLSWVPRDKESASYVENSSFSRLLFEVAWKARGRESTEVYEAGRDVLFRWSIEAGANETGWGILGRTLTNAAALVLGHEGQEAWLVDKLTTALLGDGAPSVPVRQRAARSLRETAEEVIDDTYAIDPVRVVLSQHAYGKRRSYFRQLADVLSPSAGAEDELVGIEWEM